MILSLCPPLPTPTEMAAWDRAAMDLGLANAVLMENAGRGAMAALVAAFGPVAGRRALVLAGPGNNGGDAFVLARLLAGAGAQVSTLHLAPRKKYRGAAATNLRLAARLGLPLALLTLRVLEREPAPDIVVDGLFGTGLAGPLRERARLLIEAVNRLAERAFVLAVDIPSGLSGLTGEPQPVALRANLTVTFHAAKLGLALPGAAPWLGRLHVQDIGIPALVERQAPAHGFRLGPAVRDLLPATAPDLHKGRAGHVLVVGGSPGLTGAPLLTALAALRAGAGLVTVACPADLAAEIRAGFPEVMTLPLGHGRDWTADMARELAPQLAPQRARFDALALGPGLGRAAGAGEFLAALPFPLPLPAVVDADALNWLAEKPALRGLLPAECILTPHPGEAGRLAGKIVPAIQADRPAAARSLAADLGRVVVLKGAGSLVANPAGTLLVCPLLAPCLAVAGSGDVLSGLAASLLGRGLAPLDAAGLATYWHGSAGILLGREFPGRGNLAREIADALPRALEEMRPC